MASITKEECSRSARSGGSSTSTPAWSSALTGALCELYHLELRIFGKNKPYFLLNNCYFNKKASIMIPFHHVIWSLGYVKYARSVGNKIGVLIMIITAFYTLNLNTVHLYYTKSHQCKLAGGEATSFFMADIDKVGLWFD